MMQLDSAWHHELAASGTFGIGCGLENQGATCYINSTLQCLIHNPILVNLCYRDYKGSMICGCKKCALCYIPYRIRQSFGSGSEAKLPYPRWMIDSGLATLGTQSRDRLSATQQEDAHDFLRQWLDKAHDVHERLLKAQQPQSKVYHTVIDHVFGGVLVSRVQCQQCGQVSSTFDSMNDLSVEVDNGYYGVVDSVDQALASFVEPEVMSGDNAYYCEWCKRNQTAHKSLHIHTAPNTLTLHLKRFRPDFIKLTGHMSFQTRLNLAPFLSPDSPDLPSAPALPDGRKSVSYKLIGVLVHQGNWSSAGHYYAYVLDASDQWWLMNDDIRRRVYSNEVLGSDAYMLFYVRANPRQQPPVIPPSHVAPPSSKKRCAPLSPLEEGEVAESKTADNMDLVPLCKRAKFQQQLQPQPAASAFADVSNHNAAAVAMGRSHTRTDSLSQRNSLHADAKSNGIGAGVGEGGLVSKQGKQQDEEEGIGKSRGKGGVASIGTGPSFIGPPTKPLPDASRPPQPSANGDLLTYQHRRGIGQHDTAPQLCAANGAGWNAAGTKSDQAAAISLTMIDGNSPSPAEDSPRAAADGSSRRFGFMGFALSKPLTGRSGSKLSSPAASASQPACMTPPSQRVNSAHAGLEQQQHPPPAQRRQLLASPMKPLLFEEQSGAKSGQKRSRAESFAEAQRQAESDVELILNDEAAPSAASSHTTRPRPHPHQLSSNHLLSHSSVPSSGQPPSMHRRTAAPSFINRNRLPSQKPNPATLSSDAPTYLKCAPPQARPHLQNGSSLKAGKPEAAGLNATAGPAPLQSNSSLLEQSQEPQGALTKAFGSSNGSSSSKHGSAGLGSHEAADQLESIELQAKSQASGTEPSASQLQQAIKTSSNCSKAGSGSKSVRKQTVFGKMRGKMKDTITSLFLPKAPEHLAGAQELQNLAALYPSDDCSDGP